MVENKGTTRTGLSADWFLRGVLTRLGEIVDKFTGRKWTPSSSLAASELIEKIKTLLDSEARTVEGKGTVVPHEIVLKMQWDKFSTDSDTQIDALRAELIAAVVDHINDSHYYTFSPVTLDVKTDYFTDGVRLLVGFGEDIENDEETEVNVTVPGMNLGSSSEVAASPDLPRVSVISQFTVRGDRQESEIAVPADGIITIGRSGPNTLIIDDPSVSKFHASVRVSDDGGLQLADTGSTNGTFINGGRIPYGTTTPFDTGDRVTFGTVDVSFEVVMGDNVNDVPSATSGDDEAPDGIDIPASLSPSSDEDPETDIVVPTQPAETIEILQPEPIEEQNEQDQ